MKHFYIFALWLACFSAYGQTGILTGRVLDQANLPLIGADLYIDGYGGKVTDIDGNFVLNNLPVGTHTLEVTYIGYEDEQYTFTISGGEVLEQNFYLKAGLQLSEVVITSNLVGQAKALNNQLTNAQISNVIAADQIGRFPDSNIGDAMKRIPGINVQYDQGEARFGNIRGTAPQLSSVMINGERVPSAEAEVRSVQLDLVPSDMVQSVEVSKAVTPDMDGDAIGGAVNLITRAAPSQQRISLTAGTGYNLVANKPSLNVALIYGNRFLDDKLGLIVSGSLFNNNLGSDNVEAEWEFDDANENDRYDAGEAIELGELQNRQYYLQRSRKSLSASLDFKLAPTHTIFFRTMYNQRNDWENRYRAVYKKFKGNKAKIERQTKAGIKDNKFGRLEDQDVLNLKLSGDHAFGKLKMNWSANYAKASEERPNERYFEYATDDREEVNVDITDLREPKVRPVDVLFQKPSAKWEIGEITEEYQFTNDIDFNARLDFEYALAKGFYASAVKFGARSRNKTKKRDNDFYEYSPESDDALAQSLNNLEDISKDNFLAGDYRLGHFVSREYVGGLNLGDASQYEKEKQLSELAGNFDATENILAGYAMIKQNIGRKLFVLGGVRLENTANEYQGFQYQEEDEDNGLEESLTKTAKVSNDYLDILPGLHIKYNLAPRSVLRAAVTKTIARPNYFDLVPYREIAEGNELSVGNSSLKPTRSVNLDLMAEHYFGTIGLVSAGIFHKEIKDFIVTQQLSDHTFDGKTWDDFSQPINGGNASLTGFETAFQRQLDFIAPALSGLGLYLNYTFINSKVKDFNFEGRENEDIALPGSPKHTLNASLSYDGKRFSSRVSFNYASDFIDEVGDSAFYDRYYDAVKYLDFNFNYNINSNFNVYLNVNNILNQPLRYYQGHVDRTMQAEYYNTRFDIGVKYDVFASQN